MGPWSPGTNTNLLVIEASAGPGIEGGAPALVAALQRAVAALGVEIRTGAEVRQIRVERGRVVGVRLGNETIDAPVVAAACDPKRALLDLLTVGALPHRSEHRLASVRSKGTTAWVHLALKGRVRFAARPDEEIEHARTGSHVDDVERAFDAIKYRQRSPTPILDVHVPTVSDPDLAPAGHSVVSIAVHFAPYDLEGGWTDTARAALADRAVELLAGHVPGLPDAILGRAVRTPIDIEERHGLTGGHIHHGEHALDQILIRPVPECVGYRTPVHGLFLCSSGVHPGGGLTCAPGALAAAAIP
jgi:phytoene dehydrogenase-like protein